MDLKVWVKRNFWPVLFFLSLLLAFFSGALYYAGAGVLEGDGESYLTLATHIKSGEGLTLYQINNYYPEGGFSQPDCFWVSLYDYILAPFASNTPEFFVVSKLLSVFFALIALLSFYFIVNKLYGKKPAVLGSALLGANCSFLFFSGIPRVEALVLVFILFCAFFVVAGFRNPKYWVVAGVFNGLIYLTKGTGLVYVPVFVLSVLLVYRLKALKNRYFYFYLLAFLLVASPLLVRNADVYGSPFFHCASAHMIWEDSIEESKTAYFGGKPSLGSYLESHTFWDVSARVLRGAFVVAPFKLLKLFEFDMFSNVLAVTFVSEKLSVVTAVFSSLIMGLALVSFLMAGDSKTKVYIGVMVFAVLAFYVWLVPITSSKKHIIAVLPFTLVYFAVLASKKLGEKGVFAVSVVLLLSTSAFYVHAGIKNPLASENISPEGYELISWVANNTGYEKDVILECNRMYHYNWIYQRNMLFIPVAGSMPELKAHLKRFNATYAFVCRDFVDMKFNKKAFEGNFAVGRDGLVETAPVEGWVLVKKDEILPVDYLVYRVG